MSDEQPMRVVLAVYQDREKARSALSRAAELGAEQGIVIHKDGEGHVEQHDALLPDVGRGAAVGAGIGAVGGAVAAAVFPGAGAAIGVASALTGAAAGSAAGTSITAAVDEFADRSFFRPAFDRLLPNEWAAAARLPDNGAEVFVAGLVGDLRHWSYNESDEAESDAEHTSREGEEDSEPPT